MNEIQKKKYTPPSRAIGVRVSASEYSRLVQLAEIAGLKIGKYAISCALEKKITAPVPAVNRALYSELARCGSNLNQIARKLNSESKLSGSDLIINLNDLNRSLADVRRQLLGAK